MDKLLSQLSSYLNSAQHTITAYAPVVWQSTLQLVQWTSIFYLILGFVCLIVCLVLAIWVIPFLMRRGDDATFFTFLIGIIIALATGITALVCLFDVTNWLGAFAPQLDILYHFASEAGLV